MNCNSESYKHGQFVKCENVGIWYHPRYQGAICDHHKQILEKWFPDEWVKKENDAHLQ
jgi:hypothetical protein